MKLRIGQAVYSTDGLFGELADIVVDPTSTAVTHIVVEPSKRHQQARLVPIWLVRVENEIVHISLSAAYVRQLQRVAFDDFVRPKRSIAVTGKWDVGDEDVIIPPFLDVRALSRVDRAALDQSESMSKTDCEIRRRSEVTTSDFHLVGLVEGFISSDSRLIACVVLSGVPGHRRHKIVPLDRVEHVYDREIILSMDREEFDALPVSPGLDLPGLSPLVVLDLRTRRMTDAVRDGASRLSARTRHRYRRAAVKQDQTRADL